MTDPTLETIPQIFWIGEQGFDFVDLAVEPPRADVGDLEPHAIRDALARKGLGVIVHTSPWMPFGNPSRAVQAAVLSDLMRCLDLARALRAPLLTTHYLGGPRYFSRDEMVAWYAEVLSALCRAAEGSGVCVAVENSPRNREEAPTLRDLLQQVPALRLVLDVAHANVNVPKNIADTILADHLLGGRISHVHVSDNNGGDDQHLPLGGVARGIDWPEAVGLLKKRHYDGTITLEIHSPDRDYLLASRDKFKAWWAAA